MRVSFLEIYQEQIRDLLIPDVDPRDISIRESKGQIVVSGVHEEKVETIQDMLK
jgi:HSP20 family molecular chaperone IbpA